MPKIPVYERQFDKESVSLNTPKQSFDTNIAMFGGGDAAGLKSLGSGAADVGTVMLATAKRMKQEEDETSVLDAYRRYHDAVGATLQGDGSPETGLYNRLGQSAIGLTKEAKQTLEQAQQEIAGTLKNGDQQRLFMAKAGALTSESLLGAARHEGQQRRTALTENYKAAAKKENSYALLNFTDPDLVNNAISRMEESARSAARMSGLSPEATDEAVRSISSNTLKDVAMRHIENGNLTTVQGLLQDERLTGDDAAAIEKSFKVASDRAKSYDVFQQAIGQEDPLGWIREQDIDPLIRDQAEQRTKSEIQWKKSEQKEAEAVAARTSEDALVRALEAKDLDTVQRVIEDAPAGLRKEFSAYRDSVLSGKSVEDDPAEKWKWTQMLADNPAKFRDEWNSPAVIAKLSPGTREKFDNAYISMGKKGATPVVDEIRSDTDILKGTATVLGINMSLVDKEPEVAEKYAALERKYSTLIQEATDKKGSKLTTSEKQKIVDDEILYKGQVKEKGWFGTSMEESRKFNAEYDKNQTFKPDASLDPRRAVYWEAQQQGVNPTLALRVMMAESGGNATAVSPKKARGLMQLMPGTAKDLGVDPDDPNENVHGGVKYLGQMMAKYDNDSRLALIAYNWGPAATDKWIRSGADVSALPDETRNYVLKILKPQG